MSKIAKKTVAQRILEDPLLSQQWDEERNAPDSLETSCFSCDDYVWWRCHCGYHWISKIQNRFYGEGCPLCNGNLRYKRHCV